MAITVVCSGCQSQYQVSEDLAGKRAKCKKCGEVLELQPVPAASGAAEGQFDDLDKPVIRALPNMMGESIVSPPPKPTLREPDAKIPYNGPPIGDDLKLAPDPDAEAELARRARPANVGNSGAAISAAILSTILTLCATGVIFFAMVCTGEVGLGIVAGGLGVIASMACCLLGILRKPGLAWATFAVYGVICLLGLGKVGLSGPVTTRLREIAERQRRELEGSLPKAPDRVWVPPDPNHSGTSTPGSNPNLGSPSTPPKGWTPPPAVPEDIKQPRTEDWNVVLDPPPEWAQVGEGREFSLVLDQPGYDPIKHATGYAKAVGFQHQLGGQEVFEVWDLNKRRKIGQLKGRNAFRGETSLSPDGQYIAGEVNVAFDPSTIGGSSFRPSSFGGWNGPIQVWSVTAGQRVCEIPAPAVDRRVDILDYASPETLLAVYRRGDQTVLKVWNISDSTERISINLGSRYIDRRRYAFSPGRRYFVLFDNQTIRFFELLSGNEQGKIYLPSSYRCEALTFSPDGTEFAALCHTDHKAKIIVWQTETGEMRDQVALENDPQTLLQAADKTGGMALGWLGEEGWVCGGLKLVSRKDGKVLWSSPQSNFNQTPPKLLDSDQMITTEKFGNSLRVALRTFPYGEMDSVNKALAAGGTAIDAKLLPLGKADWADVKEVEFKTGAPWTAVADPRPPMKTGAGNKPITLTPDRLAGLQFSSPTQAQAVALDVDQRSPEHSLLDPQVVSYLQRFDLQTGKSIVRHKVPGGSELMAISPSGQRAALTIGADEGRIDVYALGERASQLCAWRPYLDENPKAEVSPHQRQHSRQSVQWAGFIDEDHLLTMNRLDGQLVLWKLPEMKAIYRLPTGSTCGGALSPTGKYLLVCGSDRFALIETKTGQVAGELPLPYEPLKNTTNLSAAFSADGSRIAAKVPDAGGWFLFAFDMKNGREIARMPVSQAGNLQWCGPRQLLAGGERGSGGGVHLLDLDRRATVWRYQVFSGYRLATSPDDRVWLIAGGYHQADSVLVAQPFQLSSQVTAATATLPFSPPPVFGPGSTVTLDTSGVGSSGSPDLAERVKQAWTNTLTARGVRIGEGGLRLVASTSSGNSRSEQYSSSGFGVPSGPRFGPFSSQPPQGSVSFTTTDINLMVQLQDTTGKKLWETKSVASYSLPYSVQGDAQNRSPSQIMAEQQTAVHRSATDSFFLGVRLPYMIYPQVTDKDGQPGLGVSMINLDPYVRDVQARPVDSATAGNKDAMQQMYQKVLTDNVDAGNMNWLWCPGLERPVVSLRWALGVQMDLKSGLANQELRPLLVDNMVLRDLERVAGPIGPSLVQMLRAKQSEGKFGTFAEVGDDKMREVVLLGTGERAQLAAAARKAAVDLVLIIKLEPVVKGRLRDAQLSLEVLDLASGKKLWATEPLQESRVQAAKSIGQDLLTEASDRMGEDIESKLMLAPLASMPDSTSKLRSESPVLHRANPLAALCEIDLYLCREQISSEIAIAAFAKILGNSTDAADLASDNPKTREAAIEKILPTLVDKMQ